MAEETVIDKLYHDYKGLLDRIRQVDGTAPYVPIVEDNFKKALLLAAASHFEHQITRSLESFVEEQSKSDQFTEFVKNRAIERQYFSYFNWDAKNANKFFALFGDGFLSYMESRVRDDEHLERSVIAFLAIGKKRNDLVHNDYASFPLEMTADEIYELYGKAREFTDSIPDLLRASGEPAKT